MLTPKHQCYGTAEDRRQGCGLRDDAYVTEVPYADEKTIELGPAKRQLVPGTKTSVGLRVVAFAAITIVDVLLIFGILALADVLPMWGSGLLVSGAVLSIAAFAVAAGGARRVPRPIG